MGLHAVCPPVFARQNFAAASPVFVWGYLTDIAKKHGLTSRDVELAIDLECVSSDLMEMREDRETDLIELGVVDLGGEA